MVQIVDGEWSFDSNGVRTVQIAYDRILGIGEMSWTDYEIEVPITIHGTDDANAYNPISVAPGIGILMRWEGHTDTPIVCPQPHCGWIPSGAAGWYDFGLDNGTLFISSDYDYIEIDNTGRHLALGTTYIWKMRAETVRGGTEYSLKVWPQAQSEPANWDMQGIEPGGLTNGSLLLIAHHVDATFGDITVSSISTPQYSLSTAVSGSGIITVTPDKPSTIVGSGDGYGDS